MYSEAQRVDNEGNFRTTESRHRFIQKVYTILSVQLICTFGLAFAFKMIKSVEDFAKSKAGLIFTCIALAALVCVTETFLSTNYICYVSLCSPCVAA